jgi:hypothetical protein
LVQCLLWQFWANSKPTYCARLDDSHKLWLAPTLPL